MPVILHVNYTPSEAQNATPRDQRIASAQNISRVDGLGWKVWVRNPQSGDRGGIYLFDDHASAKAWADDVGKRLAAGGGSKLSLTYFEIDEELSAITHAPIAKTKVPA